MARIKILCCFMLFIYFKVTLVLEQGLATSTGNVPLSSNRRAMANPAQTPLHPLSKAYWEEKLKSINSEAYQKTQVNKPVTVKGGKTKLLGYFDNGSYQGRKLQQVQEELKPINTIDAKLADLPATGPQICLYRCMSAEEARAAGIDTVKYTPKLADASMQRFTGHVGHPDDAKDYCRNRQQSQGSEPPVLVEFLLRPNVQELLFSPHVAAIGTKSASTAVIAETAIQKGEKTTYVVPTNAQDGFVKGFMGIKSETSSFSFALQASGNIPYDTDTKKLLIKLTQHVKAIPLDKEPTCTPAP